MISTIITNDEKTTLEIPHQNFPLKSRDESPELNSKLPISGTMGTIVDCSSDRLSAETDSITIGSNSKCMEDRGLRITVYDESTCSYQIQWVKPETSVDMLIKGINWDQLEPQELVQYPIIGPQVNKYKSLQELKSKNGDCFFNSKKGLVSLAKLVREQPVVTESIYKVSHSTAVELQRKVTSKSKKESKKKKKDLRKRTLLREQSRELWWYFENSKKSIKQNNQNSKVSAEL